MRRPSPPPGPQIETASNARGLCALSSAPEPAPAVLACPGLHQGEVRVELLDARRSRFIVAHVDPLAALALTPSGGLLATASEKGTLVRVWNTADGSPLMELRRGTDRADIHSLAFSPAGDWLALSSDKGTIHVFALSDARGGAPGDAGGEASSSAGAGGGAGVGSGSSSAAGSAAGGRPPPSSSPSSSAFGFLKGFLPKYFHSEWSYAQCRIVADEGRAVVAFSSSTPGCVLVATAGGGFHRLEFDPQNKAAGCTAKFFARILATEAEGEGAAG